MAWNADLYRRELLYENHGSAKHPKYKLTGWVRVTRPDGETFLETLPNQQYFRNMVFEAIQEVPLHRVDRTESAGLLNFVGGNNAREFGRR